MKKLKRIGLLMLVLVIMIGFAGCGGNKKAEKPKPKPKPTYTAKQIMTKLKKDYKLPIVQEKTYNEKNDPNQLLGRPNQYSSKSNWNDKRDAENVKFQNDEGYQKIISKDSPNDSRECTVEVFKTKADMEKMKQYLENLPVMPLKQYMYNSDKAITRITFALTPKQAKKYEKAFYEIMEVKKKK